MAGARMRRVNEAIREVVSTHIAEDLADPRIGFVTVTAVDTTSDLRHARVYVTVLGGDDARENALRGLDASRGYLQAHIGTELTMKRTPTLEFRYDESTDRGMRISRLIDQTAPPAGEGGHEENEGER
jgi:ribosome-binding factor A